MALTRTPKPNLLFFILFIGVSCYLYPNASYARAIAANHSPNDTILSIPFGHGNTLTYHFESGSYTATFKSGLILRNATAVTGQTDNADALNIIYSSTEMTYSHFTTKNITSPIGKAVQYKIFRKSSHLNGSVMVQSYTIFKDKDYFLTSVIIQHVENGMNYSSPLSGATVSFPWQGKNYAVWSPFDNDMWGRFDGQLLDTVNFTSSEVSAVYNQDRRGLVVGSLEHEVWKSGITIQTGKPSSFSLTAFGGYTNQKVTHDVIRHGEVLSADSSCRSPQIMVGYFDDWRLGMEVYGTNNRLTEAPVIQPWKGGTPVGWNSWGVIQDKIDLSKAKGVIDFFADSCTLFRTKDHQLYIDLDSYWDNMVKGGIDGNADSLKAFVNYCKEKGFEPGIYWAPFTDWGKQGSKQVEGSNYTYKSAWTSVNGKYLDVDGARAMDPTHPATRKRMKKYIEFFKSCGFKMIKIDFLGHATLEADHFYNPKVKTGMEAFRSGMEYLDSLIDNTMLVYAAISPNLATGRYVHMRRIACDAFKSIDETAYTLNSTTYGWWQSHLYDYMDADHVVFSDATPGEHRARLASAVVTGSLITGDDYGQPGPWRKTAMQLLQNQDILSLVGIDGKSFRPYSGTAGNSASQVFEKRIGQKLYLAVFNYKAKPSTLKLPYSRLGIVHPKNINIIMGEQYSKVSSGSGQLIVSLPQKDAVIFSVILPK